MSIYIHVVMTCKCDKNSPVLCVRREFSHLFSGAGNASFLCPDNGFVLFGLLCADGLCAPSSIVTTSKCVGHLLFQL